jgi:hypothetical protein
MNLEYEQQFRSSFITLTTHGKSLLLQAVVSGALVLPTLANDLPQDAEPYAKIPLTGTGFPMLA